MADVGLAVIALLGIGFTFGIARSEVTQLTPLFLIVGLGFAALGLWGLLTNGAATATFDARLQTLTIKRRGVLGARTETIHLADLTRIDVHEDDAMHTLAFHRASEETILFETTFTGNPAAYDIASEAQDWLSQSQKLSDATQNYPNATFLVALLLTRKYLSHQQQLIPQRGITAPGGTR
ncbi:hypothetical protein [Gymnodinialimonas hymeniacidonis]|uniref:hypothetical protein n=1 Tax=Gymnodinialimonas hymeniacidonis TaxID=3126508 RepID=UPI0034C6BC59